MVIQFRTNRQQDDRRPSIYSICLLSIRGEDIQYEVFYIRFIKPLSKKKNFFLLSIATLLSRYQIENIDLMLNNIKPILDKVKLNTYKAKNYNIAIKVCEIIRTRGYKTDDALKDIVELAYDSNKLGKRRRISKEEFLKKISES